MLSKNKSRIDDREIKKKKNCLKDKMRRERGKGERNLAKNVKGFFF